MEPFRLKYVGELSFRNLPSSERPDLNLLNSLWALYSNMLEKETGGLPPTLVQPALRGLTELFLVVENLAQVNES